MVAMAFAISSAMLVMVLISFFETKFMSGFVFVLINSSCQKMMGLFKNGAGMLGVLDTRPCWVLKAL